MLSLESAGSLLLVCLGVSVLVILCCAALLIARTRIAPHADCKRITDQLALRVEDLAETVKHQTKTRAGRARGKKDPEPEPEPEKPEPVVEQNGPSMQEVYAEINRRRLGRG